MGTDHPKHGGRGKAEGEVEAEPSPVPPRRRCSRLPCVLPVDCRGVRSVHTGRTVDLSRLGALIEIVDPDFLPRGTKPSVIEVAKRVAQAFPKTIDVRIHAPDVRAEARIVRVIRDPVSGSLFVGCEFTRPLSTDDCAALGVDPSLSTDVDSA